MIFIGLFIVLLGLAIILEEFFKIPTWKYISLYWPSILAFYGIIRLFQKDKSKNWSLAIIFLGILLQLKKLNIVTVNIFTVAIAIFLIYLGISIIFDSTKSSNKEYKYKKYGSFSETYVGSNNKYSPIYIYDNFLNENISFKDLTLVVESPNFTGGQINSKFSEVTIDLRATNTTSNEIDMDISILFGEVKLLLPQNWHVIINNQHYYSEYESNIKTILNITSTENFSTLKIL